MDVSAMRARLMMKVVTLGVTLVLTIMSARACSGSSPSSPLDPANLAHNGLSGLCANQQAVQAAAGDESPSNDTLQVPASDNALAQMAGLGSGSFDCSTTTTGGSGD